MPSASPRPHLRQLLETLYARTDGVARRDRDPVRYAHRYADPRDAELAALLAVTLAYGRVDLFFPQLDVLFDHLDAHGGPYATVSTYDPRREAEGLSSLRYRWNRSGDFVLLLGALHRALRHEADLETVFSHGDDARSRLTHAVDTLRGHVVDVHQALGGAHTTFEALPRGVRYLLPSPRSGSACKRWNLFLRWVVRPTTEGVDLGLWTRAWRPSMLRMPLDVHVHRITRFLGLTHRNDTSWRTVDDLTRALRAFDAHDPVRYDFAIAHLGISKACVGKRDATICPACPLTHACTA